MSDETDRLADLGGSYFHHIVNGRLTAWGQVVGRVLPDVYLFEFWHELDEAHHQEIIPIQRLFSIEGDAWWFYDTNHDWALRVRDELRRSEETAG